MLVCVECRVQGRKCVQGKQEISRIGGHLLPCHLISQLKLNRDTFTPGNIHIHIIWSMTTVM